MNVATTLIIVVVSDGVLVEIIVDSEVVVPSVLIVVDDDSVVDSIVVDVSSENVQVHSSHDKYGAEACGCHCG
jgi:hypothetical protein